MRKALLAIVLLAGFVCAIGIADALAAKAEKIDTDVDSSLKKFKEIVGSKEVIEKAKGILVFPKVYKAGFGLGAEYGEGALRINGKTVDYYSTASASLGFQLGGQKKTIIIAFMQKDALKQFRQSSGWKIGADASVVLITVGTGGAIDTATTNEPIVAFVLDQKGLMVNVTLEGSKITKLNKK